MNAQGTATVATVVGPAQVWSAVFTIVINSPVLLAMFVYMRLSGDLLVAIYCDIRKIDQDQHKWIKTHYLKMAAGGIWMMPFLMITYILFRGSISIDFAGLSATILTAIFIASVALLGLIVYWIVRILP